MQSFRRGVLGYLVVQPVATEVNQGAEAALHIAMTSIQKIYPRIQTAMRVSVSIYGTII